MSKRPYYGWVIVVLAAMSMVATLPGRTVGLGLITEPLLLDLDLERTQFAKINVIATLIGSLFALAAGPLTDRLGLRVMLSSILLILGSTVLTMSQMVSAGTVTLFLILIRGFGQSALSTTSITSVGKWFTKRLAIAMGVFSLLVAIGFSVAIVSIQSQIESLGWRHVWIVVGVAVIILGGISALIARRGPKPADSPVDGPSLSSLDEPRPDLRLSEALQTPCFWMFGIAMALYSGVLAGVSLFNQSILQELGFGVTTFRYAMAGLMSAGLIGDPLAAWATRYLSLPRIVALSLWVLALVLLTYPRLQTASQVISHASLYGFCGGVFSVVYFTGFGHAFGRTHLGKIQGCAQVMTVVASALGPWWLASVKEATGSYFPMMIYLAPVFALLGVMGWLTKLPRRSL